MPSGNDGLSGGAGREMDRGKRVPGSVEVLVVMEEGWRGGGRQQNTVFGWIGGRWKYCHGGPHPSVVWPFQLFTQIAIEHFSHKGRAQSTPWAS